jgi:hypothetical protein
MDQGATLRALIADMEATIAELGSTPGDDLAVIRTALGEGVQALARATDWILASRDANAVMAVSVDYLMLTGYVCGGWQMARAARVAHTKLASGQDPVFHEAKLITARFYAEHILPKANALLRSVQHGGVSIMALTEEQF